MSHPCPPAVTEKEEMYAALFAEQARRGMSQEGISRRTGIRLSTLSWWRKEIRRREALRSSMAMEFVPVTIGDPDAPPNSIGFEVLLPNGVRLHVPTVFDKDALHGLVSTLASAC